MKSKSLKFIVTGFILIIIVVVLWFVLLRPSEISQESMTESFENNKESFYTVAEYLAENKIDTKIYGNLTDDNNYNIPKISEDTYKQFSLAVEEIFKEGYSYIVSDEGMVEFVYPSSGGLLNKLNVSVIYNGKNMVEGKITVPLNKDGWHLYIYSGNMEG